MMPKNRNPISNSANIMRKLRETNVSSFYDNWGPEEVIHLYDPEFDHQVIIVIDHTINGPSSGYFEISNQITPYSAFQKSRENTWGNALFGLPFGGNCILLKSESMSSLNYKSYIRIIEKLSSYIPNKIITHLPFAFFSDFSFIKDNFIDLKGLVGKPLENSDLTPKMLADVASLGSILEEIYDTAEGEHDHNGPLTYFVEGNPQLAYLLSKYVDKEKVNYIDPDYFNGIAESKSWLTLEDSTNAIRRIPSKQHRTKEGVLYSDCDILIITSNILETGKITDLNCKVVINASNLPFSDSVIQELERSNIVFIPNILVRGGERIATYFEYIGKSIEIALSEIPTLVKSKFLQLLALSQDSGLNLRHQAIELAKENIREMIDEVN